MVNFSLGVFELFSKKNNNFSGNLFDMCSVNIFATTLN